MVYSSAEMRQVFGKASPYIGLATDGYDGNAQVQIDGLGADGKKGFPCIILPPDCEAGEVTFSRPSPGTASVVGTAGPWALTAGMTLILSVDGGAPQTATFDATRAVVTGAGATYAACVGGHTIAIKIDGGATQTIAVAGTENTQALYHDLINAALVGGHVVNSTGQTRLRSDTFGTGSRVQIVGGDADVLAALGLTATTATGTGDVADISAVTAAEFKSLVEADTTAEVTVSGTTPMISTPTAGAGGSIQVTGGTGNAVFGFSTVAVAGGTDTAPAGTIFAGTRVGDGSKVWLTLEDLEFAAGALSGTVRVQAAAGTSGTSGVGTVTVLTDAPEFDSTFSVSNAAEVTAVDLDTVFAAAFLVAANADNPVCALGTHFVSARHTAACMLACSQAAVARSASGRGAIALVAPPIGTSQAVAVGASGVGVSAATSGGRNERRWYFWPGIRRNTDVSGVLATVDFTHDFTQAAQAARLDPGESIGAPRYAYMAHALGTESAAPALGYDEHVALKAAGICAFKSDSVLGGYVQDEVTSSLTDGETDTTRRALADHIEDTLASRMLPYKSAVNREAVREDALLRCEAFLKTLVSEDAPENSVLASYVASDETTSADRAAGIARFGFTCDAWGNIGSIVLSVAVGAGILEVTEE